MTALVKTLILVGIVLALSLSRGSGMELWGSFALVSATMVFLPWAIYSLVRMVIRPAERGSRAARVAIWVTALALAFGVRARWDTDAREEANTAASAIQAHKVRTGVYPNSLGEVGIDAQALKAKFSLSYRAGDGKASLFYSQPSMPTVAHHYAFDTNSWDKLD